MRFFWLNIETSPPDVVVTCAPATDAGGDASMRAIPVVPSREVGAAHVT